MELTRKLDAEGTIILDPDGEAVDLFSNSPDFELDFIGARAGLILPLVEKATANIGKGQLRALDITTDKLRIVISTIQDGYFLLVTTTPDKPITKTIIESEKTIKNIVAEMG
jgi:predicted regulator of Ras-like GTPase activity (Roadblock/LC7/MglB family)